MTQRTSFNCPLLRARLRELYDGGMTWVRMQQKSDVNQTTISRFTQGEAGLQPETYHKLRNALGKDIPVIGTQEHETAILLKQPAPSGIFAQKLIVEPQPKPEITAVIRVTGADFTYDGLKLGFSFDGDYREIDLPSGTNVEFEVNA